MARVRLQGTQAGAFTGADPSRRAMTAEGVETYRVAGGKIAEGWSRLGPLVPMDGVTESEPDAEPVRQGQGG